jgi:hypothetical protein
VVGIKEQPQDEFDGSHVTEYSISTGKQKGIL